MRRSSTLLVVLGLGLIAGACDREFLPQRDPAPWVLRAPVSDEARQIQILTEEQNCASGERADRRAVVTVAETDETVTIAVEIRRRTGLQECPGNPWTPLVVELSSQLDGRLLVDGSTGEARENQSVWRSVLPGTPAIDIPPVSPLTRSAGIPDHRLGCEEADLPPESTPASWMSDREVVPSEPDVLLGYAVHRFGLKPTGWHEFSYLDDRGRTSYVWAQYYDGVPVGVVSALPALVGHNLTSSVCGGGDWVPDQAVPEGLRFEARERAHELDLDGIFAATPGFEFSEGGISFADPTSRCPAWIAFEDNLEEAGLAFHLGAGYIQPPDLDDLLETQITALVSNEVGAAALVSTAPGGVVTIGPAPRSSLTEDPPRFPWLQPCPLDTPIAVDVQPLN